MNAEKLYRQWSYEAGNAENQLTVADNIVHELHQYAMELEASNRLMIAALEAHEAWSWAEENHGVATFDERVELCRYAAWLTQRALASFHGKTQQELYQGVPRMVIWPDHGGLGVRIDRADVEDAQAIVDRILESYRAAIRASEQTNL